MFKNLKIGVRLGIGFASTLAFLVIVAVVSVLRLGALNDEIELMVNDRFPKTVQANDVISAINTIARQLRNAYIYSGAEQQTSLDAIAPERKKITDNLEILEKTITTDRGKELLKNIQAARLAYVGSQDKFIELLKAGKKEEIVLLMQGELRKTQNQYIGDINALIDYQTKIMIDAGKAADETVVAAERTIVILGLIAALLTILFAWFITRSITRPVSEALHAATALAEGDLTVRIESDSKDEVAS